MGIRIADGLHLSTSPDLLRRLLEPDPPPRTRLVVGYSGWGPGQLDDELEDGSWIVERALPEDVFTEDPEGLWSGVLRRKGGPFAVLAAMPPDPTQN